MRALVVFESMFGNTQEIAEAIADGLSGRMQVDLVEVGAAPAEVGDEVALLVVVLGLAGFVLYGWWKKRKGA